MISKANSTKSGLCVRTIIALSLLVCCAEAGADMAKGDYKDGARYEKAGQFFQAAEAYARTLRLTPGDQKARAALARVGNRAMAEKLSTAEALASELRLDEAIVAVDVARRLRDQITALKIELDQPGTIDAIREQLVARRANALLAEADRAQKDGLWSAAIAHLRQVETLVPDFEDTRKRLHDVWVSWGEGNLGDGRLRAAAERFEQAARVPGPGSAAASSRAAAIRAGLGISALDRGACRGALADLRAAERLAPGSVQQDVLQRASMCARTCVQLDVAAEPDSGFGETQLDELRTDVRGQVGSRASEFLVVQKSNPGRAPSCDQHTVPGAGGQPLKVGPYVSVVRVTAMRIIRQPASSVTRQGQSRNDGMSATYFTYEEYREVLTGSLSGWVNVADQGSGSIRIALPVQVTGDAVVKWRRAPFSSATYQDHFTGRQAPVIMIDATDRGTTQLNAERGRARADLSETLIAEFATEATRLLLATIDIEPAVPDPATLPEEHSSNERELR